MTNATRKLLPSFLVLLVFLFACIRLGLWQWDRASDFKKEPVEQSRVDLSTIAQPGKSLDPTAYGRLVRATGEYEKSWLVDQRTVGERTGTWQVALLRTDRGGVLVVRGWTNGTNPLSANPKGTVTIEGRLYPAQTQDTSAPALDADHLSRVDPALIVNTVAGPLIDGYVIATAESASSSIDIKQIEKVDAPLPKRNPPGFYWQHISYVILWWFFGLLAIVVWVRSARELRYGSDRENSTR